ncbi:MAG TPA: hypothetical protein VFV27_03345 [Nevskiaceae bacterium]|nr:hypothetical protein [Nevskiaceae bacterium]
MTRIAALLPLLVLLVSACSEAVSTAPPPAPASPSTPPAASGALVIRLAAGGAHPDRFCIPQWSIANETAVDVGALLIELEWRGPGEAVIEPAAALGTLVEPLPAGRRKDLTLNGYTAACGELRLVARRYACRDSDAVRQPCPGPLRMETADGMTVDLGAAREGPMKGAVEPR